MSLRLALVCLILGSSMPVRAQSLVPFAPPTCTPMPSGLYLLPPSADFDGDGDLDFLARTLSAPSLVTVVLQGPGGVLSVGPSSPVAALSNMWPDFGDLDGDGLMDVCTFSTAGGITLLFQRPNGFLRTDIPAPSVSVNRLDLLDWNQDGSPDIVLGRKEVLLNDGTGNFTTQLTLGTSSYNGDGFVNFRDLDGDGDLDILQSNGNPAIMPASPFPLELHTVGPGGGLTTTLLATETAQSMALGAGDFDGDGDIDVVEIGEFPVGATSTQIRMRLWRRSAPGAYAAQSWIQIANPTSSSSFVNNWPLKIADFDLDGIDDVVVLYGISFQNQFKIYRGTPSGQLTLAQLMPLPIDNNFLFLGDYNQDLGPDLAWIGSSGFCQILNLSPSATNATETLTVRDGVHRHGWVAGGWPRPFVLDVHDLAAGQPPVPNRNLTVTEIPVSGAPITTTITTDAQGQALLVPSPSTVLGTGTFILQSPTTNALVLHYHRRVFSSVLNLNPPVGQPFVSVQFEQGGFDPLAFMLAIDVPLPAPGFVFTPFGDIYNKAFYPRYVSPNRRPDVLGIRRTGRVDAIEVPSRTDIIS
ncbi:MAG: VCBS repeat-containing protein, partial [Planctomycetes bacterium]|nr:VCBS repeat-containing protein [Planctomycetota bacterium]